MTGTVHFTFMHYFKIAFFILNLWLLIGCTPKESRLPYLGNPAVKGTDTVYPKIADFRFTNQDGAAVTNKTFENKIYVADFIFLSCPTICPKMTSEMRSVYEIYKNNTKIAFLSHTIDPERDTVEKLKLYAQSMNLNSSWHFVTGNRDSIYGIATKSYFATAYKDSREPGGYVHSGGLLLVDKNRFIRGVYDGTDSEETGRLVRDIKILLRE